MKKLEALLTQLESKIPFSENSNNEVSKGSVGWINRISRNEIHDSNREWLEPKYRG
jgi:hypothetical protein